MANNGRSACSLLLLSFLFFVLHFPANKTWLIIDFLCLNYSIVRKNLPAIDTKRRVDINNTQFSKQSSMWHVMNVYCVLQLQLLLLWQPVIFEIVCLWLECISDSGHRKLLILACGWRDHLVFVRCNSRLVVKLCWGICVDMFWYHALLIELSSNYNNFSNSMQARWLYGGIGKICNCNNVL